MRTLTYNELPELEQGIAHERAYNLYKSILPTDFNVDALVKGHLKDELFHEVGGNYFQIELKKL
jgi:hypothetical protein